jgi:integrase
MPPRKSCSAPGRSSRQSIGLDPAQFGTDSLRRAKATLDYRRTGNLRAVQLLLGHTKVESTVMLPSAQDGTAAFGERRSRERAGRACW